MERHSLELLARRWADEDPEEDKRLWVQQALNDGDWDALKSAFSKPLTFGTAGLRGRVGAGPARMNLATVSRVSWALGQFVLARHSDKAPPIVVIGFDARPDSESFARRAAAVLSACGVSALLTKTFVPTPLVAFAVRKVKASAGVVVTASHNPREDNGYKVYDDQGVQIVAPWDVAISDLMRGAPPTHRIPVFEQGIAELDDAVATAYLQLVRNIADGYRGSNEAQPLRVAYTPLHGVGGRWVELALGSNASLVDVTMPQSQCQPDGTFPTVPFPNPEEPGALDELVREMVRKDIDVGLANDPDADRFSMCLRLDGAVIQLSGDAIGLLLADACLRRGGEERTVVSTVVSSPALDVLANHRSARVVRTLTGFKWLCRVALLEPSFAFAYEEALGYCFAAPPGEVGVLDKDGICAASVMCELLLQEGGAVGLYGRLCGLYQELGFWEGFGRSMRFEGNAAAMERWMANLRASLPQQMAYLKVHGCIDFLEGAETRPMYLGETDLLQFDLSLPEGADTEELLPHRGRVLIRPSGTEPKLKFYIHLCSRVTSPEECALAREQQRQVADRIFAELGRDSSLGSS